MKNTQVPKARNDKKMASKEDYKQAKEKIESFIDDLTSFKQQNEIHANILIGYDEVISHKASRLNLMELEEKMHLNFKKFEVVKVLLGK